MLDPWIIEEIRRREAEQRQREERSRIEIQIETPSDQPSDYERRDRGRIDDGQPTPGSERGVTIIDFSL